MSLRRLIDAAVAHDGLNFVITNRVPRRALTLFMGWFSRIEQPLIRDMSIAAWRWFDSSLDLSEARQARFASLHDCFVRELRAGARPIANEADILVSPADAIVGAHGRVEDGWVVQAKDDRYPLAELLCDATLAAAYTGGTFVTLRLTAAMYHRFHAPDDGIVRRVTYVPGDVWNVNPAALRRVARLFCRNERAVVHLDVEGAPAPVLLVAVAAVLVASIRIHAIGGLVRTEGPSMRACTLPVARGDEMGWFEHGSTIVVVAPPGLEPCTSLREGTRIRMGEPLLRRVSR